jgi:hypothetical protein
MKIMLFERYSDTMTAYHGSRYDFDSFSLSMFGEGEGASGWGYGVYFSEDKEDAKEYARKLAHYKSEERLYQVRIPAKQYYFNLDEYYDDQSKYVKDCLSKISFEQLKKIYRYDYHVNKEITSLNNIIENGEYDDVKYISAKEYFDSDEYKEDLLHIYRYRLENLHGQSFFKMLEESLGDEYDASEFLASLGIKGNIHYQFGSANIVVFNDEDITITKKTKPRF